MPPPALRVVRAPPGLVWRAFDADQAVGAVRAFLRPDNRWFVAFEACSADSYGPLLAAVAEDTRADLHAMVDQADSQALDRLARLGFTVSMPRLPPAHWPDSARSGTTAPAQAGPASVLSPLSRRRRA
jgi:hypothetical protein